MVIRRKTKLRPAQDLQTEIVRPSEARDLFYKIKEGIENVPWAAERCIHRYACDRWCFVIESPDSQDSKDASSLRVSCRQEAGRKRFLQRSRVRIIPFLCFPETTDRSQLFAQPAKNLRRLHPSRHAIASALGPGQTTVIMAPRYAQSQLLRSERLSQCR